MLNGRSALCTSVIVTFLGGKEANYKLRFKRMDDVLSIILWLASLA